ncbi:hypothetical protein FRB94_012500 [Tulasnella sp. JGI-2019a]|nr:hypothetical protein FRB94_012500 [Tulasnella sp. JGI-2019a]
MVATELGSADAPMVIDDDSEIEEIMDHEIQFIKMVGPGSGRAKSSASETPQPPRPTRSVQRLPAPQSTPGPSNTAFSPSHSPPPRTASKALSRKRPGSNDQRTSATPSKRLKSLRLDTQDDVMSMDVTETPVHDATASPTQTTGEVDPDSDWESYHAGYFFPPIPLSRSGDPPLENSTQESAADAVIKRFHSLTVDTPPPDCSIMHTYQPWKNAPIEYLPDRILKTYYVSTRRSPVYASFSRGKGPEFMAGPALDLNVAFRKASGAVNYVAQSGPHVAIASCTVGDHPSVDNVPGALMYWRRECCETPEVTASHFVDVTQQITGVTDQRGQLTQRAPPPTRIYHSTVTTVKFDPLRPNVFVSASSDMTVRSWLYCDKLGRVREALAGEGICCDYAKAQPQVMDFKPLSSILAVGCTDGCTYIHTPHTDDPKCLELRSTMNLEITSQVWGPPNSLCSDRLFIGGGSPFVEEKVSRRSGLKRRSPIGKGWASAWAVRPDTIQRVCNFLPIMTKRRYCENLAVDPTGQRLSIVSFDEQTDASMHTVDFMDLRAPSGRSMHRQDLPPFASDGGQVISACFSPDGIFWSCAREDNVAHVWDSRFMNRDGKPLRTLRHGPSFDPKDAYGITEMTWLNQYGSSSPPVLVTGGNDGRIAEWDMRTTKPRILATLETSVGHFSIGDIYKDEAPLIAGDNGGKVYIYSQRRHPP